MKFPANLTELHDMMPDEWFWRFLDLFGLREGYLWLMEEVIEELMEEAAEDTEEEAA